MSLILLLTGFIGFISSFSLLHLGIDKMWIRYPLAILSAYAAFLLLLRLWLAIQRSQFNADSSGDVDFVETNRNPDSGFGGNADFGGGGAGGSWDGGNVSSNASVTGSGLDGFDFDLDEIGVLILAIVAIIGGIVASFYIIYIAPILLAEILVDGLLLGGLHRRVRHIEQKHWLQTAVYKTFLPAILCALFFMLAGGLLQSIAPEAKSIGEVLRSPAQNKPKSITER